MKIGKVISIVGGSKCLLWVLIQSLISGCAGVCIVDVATSSIIVRKTEGAFREAPLYITEDGFMTLQRSEMSTFVLRKVGFDGKDKETSFLPLFTTAYGGEAYAFSEDGSKFAFVNWEHESPMRLFVGSITNPKVNVLPTGVCDDLRASFGYEVLWVDEENILVYPDVGYPLPGKKAKPICLLSLHDMRVVRLIDVFGSYGPKQLSPSKRYLMASEGMEDSLLYRIHIIDLKEKKKVYEISPVGKKMHPRGVVWSSDDEMLYAVDNVVYAQRIGGQDKKEVLRLKPDQAAELYAVDSCRNLHYQIYDNSRSLSDPLGGWRMFNLDTKKDTQLTRRKITGKVLINREQNKIVTEIGY